MPLPNDALRLSADSVWFFGRSCWGRVPRPVVPLLRDHRGHACSAPQPLTHQSGIWAATGGFDASPSPSRWGMPRRAASVARPMPGPAAEAAVRLGSPGIRESKPCRAEAAGTEYGLYGRFRPRCAGSTPPGPGGCAAPLFVWDGSIRSSRSASRRPVWPRILRSQSVYDDGLRQAVRRLLPRALRTGPGTTEMRLRGGPSSIGFSANDSVTLTPSVVMQAISAPMLPSNPSVSV